jgi:hypothetical protein
MRQDGWGSVRAEGRIKNGGSDVFVFVLAGDAQPHYASWFMVAGMIAATLVNPPIQKNIAVTGAFRGTKTQAHGCCRDPRAW